MNSEQWSAIERACTRLCFEYARTIDFRDYDNFVTLFTDGGELDVGQVMRGREAIRQSLKRRPDQLRSRHVMTNVLIEPLDNDTARGTAYLTLFRHIGPESLEPSPIDLAGPAAVGHYEDRFRRTEGGWLFERRKLFLAFRDSALLA